MNAKRLTLLTGLLLLSAILPTPAQTEEPVDLTKGLVAYWSFDEGEGDIVFDKSGNYNDGVLKCAGEDCSPPKWVKGKIGYALEFDGEDDYVEVRDDPSIETESLSIITWIKPKSVDRGDCLVKNDGYHKGWRLIWSAKGKENILFQINLGADKPLSRYSEGKLPQREWTHTALTYDGAVMRIYLNGDLSNSLAAIGEINYESSADLYIGARSPEHPKQFFCDGMIDEIRIYNRALIREEIIKILSLRNNS